MKKPESFEEFWPEYVRAHASKLTRRIHVTATTAAIACVAGGLLTRHRWLLLVAPVVGYAPAWVSHWLIERNRPQSFEHPLWSLKADLLMWTKTLDGTMDAEVEAILAAVPARPSYGIATNMATDGTLH
jgi:hypothetical protein